MSKKEVPYWLFKSVIQREKLHCVLWEIWVKHVVPIGEAHLLHKLSDSFRTPDS